MPNGIPAPVPNEVILDLVDVDEKEIPLMMEDDRKKIQ